MELTTSESEVNNLIRTFSQFHEKLVSIQMQNLSLLKIGTPLTVNFIPMYYLVVIIIIIIIIIVVIIIIVTVI